MKGSVAIPRVHCKNTVGSLEGYGLLGAPRGLHPYEDPTGFLHWTLGIATLPFICLYFVFFKSSEFVSDFFHFFTFQNPMLRAFTAPPRPPKSPNVFLL